jgi:F0F1-type ATP synthase alpha subunit
MDITTMTAAPTVETNAGDVDAAAGTNASDITGTNLWARNALLQGIIDSGINWAQGDSTVMIEKADPYGQNVEVESVSELDKDHKS